MDNPWLTIIGIGEDGGKALPDASREALARAEFIFGGARHLQLVAGQTGHAQPCPWPIPFDVAPLLAHAGRRVVALASGDPFWFGAGAVLAQNLPRGAWVSHPAPSSFALAANRLGWSLESTICHGLHAAPFARLRADLHTGTHILATLRDGAAVQDLAAYLAQIGFGGSDLWLLSRLGGALETCVQTRADSPDIPQLAAPIMVGISAKGTGIARGFGLDDALFHSDGQITKSPIRALTLAALGPRKGDVLWDIGGGSGSVSVEWCLAGGVSHCIEARADRSLNIAANAAQFGIDHRLHIITGAAPAALAGLPAPSAVFVGGGGNAALFDALWPRLPSGCRVVANAVTLQSESLLTQICAQYGGALMRVDIAHAEALGRMQGWKAARPIVQWSAVK